MSKISRAYNSYKDFIIDSFEDYDNWKVTRCYYDGDDYGNYWGM